MLTLLVFVIKERELQHFDLLFWNQGISVGSNWAIFKKCFIYSTSGSGSTLSCAFPMKLSHGNCVSGISSAPQRWPCGLKQLPQRRVVSPWVEVGDASVVPRARRCVLCSLRRVEALAHLLSLLCSILRSRLLHWKALNYVKLKEIHKSPKLSWKVKVRLLHPARKFSLMVNCVSNWTEKQEHFMVASAFKT